MHSRHYLQADDFSFQRDGRSEGAETVLAADWSAGERIAFVAPDPAGDLVPAGRLALAWTWLFYARPVARTADFFDYPLHYVVGGEAGAAPNVLGPAAAAAWSPAWCRLDVWPSTHHVAADPDPAVLLAAVLMLEPSVLVWPARLDCPAHLDLPAGPPQEDAWSLLRTRLRSVWLYADHELPPALSGWRLDCAQGASKLLSQAGARLSRTPADEAGTFVTRMAAERFLA